MDRIDWLKNLMPGDQVYVIDDNTKYPTVSSETVISKSKRGNIKLSNNRSFDSNGIMHDGDWYSYRIVPMCKEVETIINLNKCLKKRMLIIKKLNDIYSQDLDINKLERILEILR